MRRHSWIWISLLVTLPIVGVSSFLAVSDRSERAIRTIVGDVVQATEDGINRRDLSQVEPFFATEAEGANRDGLLQTWYALRAFAGQLREGDQVRLQSLEVPSVVVHENGGLARATYRLRIQVVRGDGLIFAADVDQNLALLRTSRGWRVSGGDQPQLSNVVGRWQAH